MMPSLKNIKVVVLLLSCLTLFSCATNAEVKNSSPQTLAELINNKGSMTKALESLHHKFTVELLKDGVLANQYVRISSLKLDNTPVIAALVATNVANPTFVTILCQASTTPIGKMLFAPGANIHRRDNMKITVITVHDIKNNIIHQYLNHLGYGDTTRIVARDSEFYHYAETMDITEYVLPSMTKYFSK